jgi:hypothetical protein
MIILVIYVLYVLIKSKRNAFKPNVANLAMYLLLLGAGGKVFVLTVLMTFPVRIFYFSYDPFAEHHKYSGGMDGLVLFFSVGVFFLLVFIGDLYW